MHQTVFLWEWYNQGFSVSLLYIFTMLAFMGNYLRPIGNIPLTGEILVAFLLNPGRER